jgi:hypothetical protein
MEESNPFIEADQSPENPFQDTSIISSLSNLNTQQYTALDDTHTTVDFDLSTSPQAKSKSRQESDLEAREADLIARERALDGRQELLDNAGVKVFCE